MWRPPSSTTRRCSASVVLRASSSARAPSSPRASTGSMPRLRRSSRARKSGFPPSRMSVPRPAMFVAMVTAPTRPAGALQQLGQPLRLLDRHGSNEDRPALAVQRLDLLDDRGELLALRLVHDVR